MVTLGVIVNGTSVTFTVTNSVAGAVNRIYTRTPSESWNSSPEATIVGNGSVVIPFASGDYYAKVTSTVGAVVTLGDKDPVFFHVTVAGDVVAYYKVIGISRVPGTCLKRVALERLEKPIVP